MLPLFKLKTSPPLEGIHVSKRGTVYSYFYVPQMLCFHQAILFLFFQHRKRLFFCILSGEECFYCYPDKSFKFLTRQCLLSTTSDENASTRVVACVSLSTGKGSSCNNIWQKAKQHRKGTVVNISKLQHKRRRARKKHETHKRKNGNKHVSSRNP